MAGAPAMGSPQARLCRLTASMLRCASSPESVLSRPIALHRRPSAAKLAMLSMPISSRQP